MLDPKNIKDIIHKINILKELDFDDEIISAKIPEYNEIKKLIDSNLDDDFIIRMLTFAQKPKDSKPTKPKNNLKINIGDLYLGIDSHSNLACLITKTSEIKINYSAYNWGGHSSIEKITAITNTHPIGPIITLNEPGVYSGVDFDHGNQYPFHFEFDQIQALEKLKY